MISKKVLSSASVLAGLALLLAVLGYLKFQQSQNQRGLQAQIDDLRLQADAVQKQNDQLSQMLDKVSSSDFKEQIARQQLDYKKQGEVVYGFTSAPAAAAAAAAAAGQPQSDFRKWWNYYFAD